MITTQAHDTEILEKQVKELSSKLQHLVAGPELKDVLIHFHKPGWTTPAEYRFAHAILTSMIANVTALTTLKNEFAKATEEVVHV